ncbi:tRNA-dihydrouridine synthase B [uncultured archaeon]|nr:tRNA-dihydrouridine synthase B [uncultured archaeon]
MKFQLMLAPMEGITDAAFRTLASKNGADLTFTEMARVANLAKGKKELARIDITDSTPTQIQLAGSKLAEYERFLSVFKPSEGFRGFNLNLGCPGPSFIRQGIGAAMMKRVTRVQEIIRIINDHGYECSVKMRLGLNRYEKEKGVYLNLINGADASFFVVHAKTAAQKDSDPADFTVYDKCVATGKRIVANGGIRTREQVMDLKEKGLYGAMIGQAAIGNPEIFGELDVR